MGEEYSERNILLTNIQHFSLHDGPGIRTTVFLKGCSIQCPWCSNPENISYEVQRYHKDGKDGVYGMWFTPDEIYKEVIKDKAFYEGNLLPSKWMITESHLIEDLPGGVTFSGGEPLLQMHRLVPLLEKLKRENVHLAIETSLFAAAEEFQIALSYIDFFYIDIKFLEQNMAERVIHGNLDSFLNNADMLFRWKDTGGQYKPVVVRIPVIGGYTDKPDNQEEIKKLLGKYKELYRSPLKVELIKGHNLGNSKYCSLGLPEPEYIEVSDELLEEYRHGLVEVGLIVEVCKI